jgi:N-methylhydantoinase A
MNVPEAAAHINDEFTLLEQKALEQYVAEDIDPSKVHFLRYGRCRYQNQEHSTEIDLPDGAITPDRMAAMLEHFHANYEREYTYRLDAPVELVCYHLIAIAEVDKLVPEKCRMTGRKIAEAVKGHREVDYAEAGIHQATLYDGNALEPWMSFAGPAIIEESGTTVVIPPGFPCHLDDYGNYHISLASGQTVNTGAVPGGSL